MLLIKRILAYPLTVLFYIIFGLLLLIFHPVQVICLHLGGYAAHKRSVEILNYLIIKSFHILGSKIKFEGFEKLPPGRPLIIVANHQSAWDIPPVVWGFRRHHPKFISKKELAKNIPSISYNLRHGGSALIDRKNGSQSIKEVIKLGQTVEKNNYAVCIFPEGTRSINGQMRSFQSAGIKTLLKVAPSAIIVPFAIDGNCNLQVHKSWLMRLGITLIYKVLDPIEPGNRPAEDIVIETENIIRASLLQVNKI